MAFFRKTSSDSHGLVLVVGLGNPGEEYARTRHNAGFMVAGRFIRRHEMGRTRRRYGGRWCESQVDGHPAAVLMPLTFMNCSGDAVAEAAAKKHIPPGRIIVVHDDMDFPFGAVRCRRGGGTGGHNGLASITSRLGTPDYNRVRVGIGRPEDAREDPRDWVLSPFGTEEEKLEEVLDTAVDCIDAIIAEGIQAAMNTFNRREPPEAGSVEETTLTGETTPQQEAGPTE